MKKFLAILCILALIITTATAVFATDSVETEGKAELRLARAGERVLAAQQRLAEIQQRLAERKQLAEQRKAEIEAFRDAVRSKQEAVKAAVEENRTLAKENMELRKSFAAKVKEIRGSEDDLAPEIIEQLGLYRAELKAATAELKSSGGSLRDVIASKKGLVKELDYDKLESIYAQISAVQSNRNELLTEINGILNAMLALLD